MDFVKRHKARMSKTNKAVKKWGYWKDAVGASDYRVRGADGQWYCEWMDGFAAAVEFRKEVDKAILTTRKGFHSGNHRR